MTAPYGTRDEALDWLENRLKADGLSVASVFTPPASNDVELELAASKAALVFRAPAPAPVIAGRYATLVQEGEVLDGEWRPGTLQVTVQLFTDGDPSETTPVEFRVEREWALQFTRGDMDETGILRRIGDTVDGPPELDTVPAELRQMSDRFDDDGRGGH